MLEGFSPFFCLLLVFGGAGIRQKDGGRKMGIGTEANEGNEGGFRNQDLIISPLCSCDLLWPMSPVFVFPIFAAFFHSNLFRIAGFRFRLPVISCLLWRFGPGLIAVVLPKNSKRSGIRDRATGLRNS